MVLWHGVQLGYTVVSSETEVSGVMSTAYANVAIRKQAIPTGPHIDSNTSSATKGSVPFSAKLAMTPFEKKNPPIAKATSAINTTTNKKMRNAFIATPFSKEFPLRLFSVNVLLDLGVK